jgi:hypothetical protein
LIEFFDPQFAEVQSRRINTQRSFDDVSVSSAKHNPTVRLNKEVINLISEYDPTTTGSKGFCPMIIEKSIIDGEINKLTNMVTRGSLNKIPSSNNKPSSSHTNLNNDPPSNNNTGNGQPIKIDKEKRPRAKRPNNPNN